MTAHERRVQSLARRVRSRICSSCAWRTPGIRYIDTNLSLPCEANCPIFRHIGLLSEYADRLDPTVSSYDRVVGALAVDCCGRGRCSHRGSKPGECPLKRYRNEIAAVMREMSVAPHR
jgi:hypothetical protein